MEFQPLQFRHWARIILAWMLFIPATTSLHAEAADASPEQLQALKGKISTISRWLDQANSKKSKLAATLKRQELDIGALDKKLRQLQSKIRNTRSELTHLKQNHFKLQLSLKKQQGLLAKQITAAYQMGQQPGLKLLLNNSDPQQIARGLAYYDYINQARSDQINEFKHTLKQLTKTQRNISEQERRLALAKKDAENQKNKLENSLSERKRTVKRLGLSIKTKTKKLQQLKEERSQLEKLLREVEQAVVNIKLPDENQPFSSLKSKLPWPTHGKVTTRFGSRVAQGKLRYNGLFIKTGLNTPIVAVHYGRVVFSDWIRGFGLLLIVDHGGGFMTLYGNNRSLLKATGDWVSAGETIAYSGSSGGNDKVGLYFEIRKRGKPVNPRYWLARQK